jgi:hypothetical protein
VIPDAVIAQQLVRLGELRSAPASVDGHTAAYREASRSRDHAKRITDHLLRHQQFFPTPREIYAAAKATLDPSDVVARCAPCLDTGVVVSDRCRCDRSTAFIRHIERCCAPCVCEAGRRVAPLLGMEMERKAS